jgi:crotonobetainyl-CoA:carnitine CoA-transferase CaiB-like acyl-CoA transferase
MARLGIGYEALAEVNPRLVYCAITGYGQDGPYRDRAGHDINYTGYAGVLHATGARDGPPVLPSVQVGDFGGAMWGAIGILAALREASGSGRGRFVDVSMLDVVLAAWGPVLSSWYHATGSVPGRGSLPLTGGLACYGVYEAGDGKYLAVGALEPQFWRTLCQKVGLPELIDAHLDPDRQEEIRSSLAAAFATRPRDEWVEDLADLDTCVGPVNDIAEALEDPQVAHRGLVAEIGGIPVGPGLPIKVSGHEAEGGPGAPGFGEHTEEVLGSLGLDAAEVASLRDRGIL